jgi:VanZ family protein
VSRSGWAARWLPVLAWMSLIFLLSAQPGLRVSEDASVDRPMRTLAHLGTYAILAALLFRALRRDTRSVAVTVAAAWTIAVLYGVSDEIHQSFVPDRTGRPSDVAIDAIGAAIGLAVVIVASAVVRRRRRALDEPAPPRREPAD